MSGDHSSPLLTRRLVTASLSSVRAKLLDFVLMPARKSPRTRRLALVCLALSAATIGACGGDESEEVETKTPSSKKGGKGGTSAGTGGAGGNNAGSNGAGAGPTVSIGGSGAGLGSGGGAGPTCAAEGAEADAVVLPADIIWVVDQSGSMDKETDYVQKQINTFAAAIAKSAVDYRVVMIANPSAGNKICVPAPLGGPNCGNAARFRLVAKTVSSTNGPKLALEEYAKYSDFLRPNATKHFVFVTDDESSLGAQAFLDGLAAKQPKGIFSDLKIHAVFAWGDNKTKGCSGPFGSGARYGAVYETLVQKTGGAKGVICEDDWSKVFNDITTAVVTGSKVACEINVPLPPKGKALDPALVNVQYLPGGTATPADILRVADAASCSPKGGWYYDNPTTPARILLCPASCALVQKDEAAKIEVKFGCASVFDTPK